MNFAKPLLSLPQDASPIKRLSLLPTITNADADGNLGVKLNDSQQKKNVQIIYATSAMGGKPLLTVETSDFPVECRTSGCVKCNNALNAFANRRI